MNIFFSEADLTKIAVEARLRFPDECCGVVIGNLSDGRWDVSAVLPVSNVWDGPQESRYLISPLDYLAAERKARDANCDVIGFFHSHPNRSRQFSQFDIEQAWPGYLYLIQPIDDDTTDRLACWFVQPGDPRVIVEVDVMESGFEQIPQDGL